MEDIYEEIYSLVKQIPEGTVSTYKQVAEALGDPMAARGVAEALSLNPCPVEVPCHRVVHENLSSAVSGLELKRKGYADERGHMH